MAPYSSTWPRRLECLTAFSLLMIMVLTSGGCAHVTGNYPLAEQSTNDFKARLAGKGFLLLAGSRLRLDMVEAELRQLKSQGFSRRDPQIIKSVARRRNVPPALLADRSGCTYYRFTVHLDSGAHLTLAPGSLEITVDTEGRTLVVRDQGYLLEDRQLPGGCRPPSRATLVIGAPENKEPVAKDFLVRLPVRGEIVGLALIPQFTQVGGGTPPP